MEEEYTSHEKDKTKPLTPEGEDTFVEIKAGDSLIENVSGSSSKSVPFEIVTGVEDTIDHTLEKEDNVPFEHLKLIEEKIDRLAIEFQSKLKYDQHKETVIDNLHAELQVYKNGLMGKLLRPVFMDVIELIDDVRRLIKDMASKGEEDNVEKLKRFFAAIPEDLEDLLYKHGVEVLSTADNVFDPAIHKVIKALPTEEENLDRKVADKLKNGYRWEEKLLRHEMVNVWQYQEPLNI